ncbi:hypothetical protein IA539_22105 [Gordonia sp. zg691]|nr:hypothetical protein [Gordonia jinghuaiqii]MBD0863868.1 hypothetical protein [Gordonia jinghuaiqii]
MTRAAKRSRNQLLDIRQRSERTITDEATQKNEAPDSGRKPPSLSRA